MSVLTVEALNQFYGGSHTLWDVDLTVPQGSRTCLMGRNGMGKTTLLKCIMGLLPTASGEISLGGTDLLKLAAEERARHGIGYVPQGREIFSQLTVEENLRIGLRASASALPPSRFALRWTSRATAYKSRYGRQVGSGGEVHKNGAGVIPPQIFELFPALKQMRNRLGGDLSGGQQQQLAIGRALVFEPQLLILDEPTEGIQPNIVHEIGDIILRLNRDMGLTVLLVEQKLPFARRVASGFCILEKGRGVANGPMDDLTDEVVRAHLSV
jgi:urea transport system ATP-binding protein